MTRGDIVTAADRDGSGIEISQNVTIYMDAAAVRVGVSGVAKERRPDSRP